MKEKWMKFQSVHSGLEINKPSTGKSNITADWFRALTAEPCTIYINGTPLSKYAEEGKLVTGKEGITEENLKVFFQEVILGKINQSAQKNDMIEYLMKAFNQGGLLYPVSSALAMSMQGYASIRDRDLIQYVNIVPTNTGFKVTEFAQANSLVLSAKSEDPTVRPADGKEYVVKAQGTIEIDFSNVKNNNNTPSVSVESNNISFGNPTIEKRLDTRGLKEMLIDFIKNLVGLNVVETIAPEESVKTANNFRPNQP